MTLIPSNQPPEQLARKRIDVQLRQAGAVMPLKASA